MYLLDSPLGQRHIDTCTVPAAAVIPWRHLDYMICDQHLCHCCNACWTSCSRSVPRTCCNSRSIFSILPKRRSFSCFSGNESWVYVHDPDYTSLRNGVCQDPQHRRRGRATGRPRKYILVHRSNLRTS